MRVLLFAAGLALYVPSLLAGVELHVCKIGDAPDFIGLRFSDEETSLRLEAAATYVAPATSLPASRHVRIFAESAEATKAPEDLGVLDLPENGRYLLLLSRAGTGGISKKLLPFNQASLPIGGVMFVNLSKRRLRCSLAEESVELAPEEARRLPTAVPARRVVNLRIQQRIHEAWKTEKATTLILGAKQRFLFVIQEEGPGEPLRPERITDFDPVRNLAPLEPAPVKAEPPLPDPPAK